MDKKKVIVIGGSGGIGSEIIRTLAAQGMRVSFTYFRDKETADKLQRSGPDIVGYSINLLDETEINQGITKILSVQGGVDSLVYSVTPPILNRNVLTTQWQDHLDHLCLQTRGLFYIVQALKERIRLKQKLKFIVLGTEYCIGRPPSGLSHYVQAKYSLMGFAKSLMVDLAKYQCTVNMVSPGMVDTPLIAQLPPKLIEMTIADNPLKRIATPKDVANVVAFLISDGADYLNGVHMTVNGGNTVL